MYKTVNRKKNDFRLGFYSQGHNWNGMKRNKIIYIINK